jgi:hypothetical protein
MDVYAIFNRIAVIGCLLAHPTHLRFFSSLIPKNGCQCEGIFQINTWTFQSMKKISPIKKKNER